MDKLNPDPELDALVKQINKLGAEGGDAQGEAGGASPEGGGSDATPRGTFSVSRGTSEPPPNPAWRLPRATVEATERLESLLQIARDRNASDLLLVSGAPPIVRANGTLSPLSKTELESSEVDRLCAAAIPKERREIAARAGAVDFGFSIQGLGRFRGNVHRAGGRWAASLRLFPKTLPTLESLTLPEQISPIADLLHGLVIVSGPTGSGKSSTVAAILALIMKRRTAHVITIEDPIEYEYRHGKCVVEQIEVGRDAPSFASALRGALRQDPDVILVGEMRDPESIAIAVTAAETGHLVLSTLHTGNGPQTISRIIDAYPSQQSGVIRTQLAASLQAVISQQLVPRSDDQGRVPVVEILRCNDAVRNLIRKGQTEQIGAQVSLGRATGMLSFDSSLAQLVEAGLIDIEDARRRARHERDFNLLLGG